MKQPDHSKRIPYPHWIDHDAQVVYVNVSNWMSACAAPKRVNQWYPGYRCELVSAEGLDLKKETK